MIVHYRFASGLQPNSTSGMHARILRVDPLNLEVVLAILIGGVLSLPGGGSVTPSWDILPVPVAFCQCQSHRSVEYRDSQPRQGQTVVT